MPQNEFIGPKPLLAAKSEIADLAEAVASEVDFAPGEPLGDVVTYMGGTITMVDFSGAAKTEDGSLEIEEPGEFRIFLPSFTSRLRDRFTVAHELGHYCLHYLFQLDSFDDPPRMRATRAGKGRVEWEANWFAGSFLMPHELFEQAFSAYDRDLILVAEHFDVSQQAADVRARSLGLLSI